jgi:hypothetical protein
VRVVEKRRLRMIEEVSDVRVDERAEVIPKLIVIALDEMKLVLVHRTSARQHLFRELRIEAIDDEGDPHEKVSREPPVPSLQPEEKPPATSLQLEGKPSRL